MRKKLICFVTAFLLAALIASLAAGCKPDTPVVTPPGGNVTDADGFTEAQSNVELMTKDLIGGLNSTLRLLTTGQITSSRPAASASASMDMRINDREARLTFAAEYNRKLFDAGERDAARSGMTVTYEGENEAFLELYYFTDDGDSGEAYIALNGNKIIIPLENSSFNTLLPITAIDASVVTMLLNPCLAVTGDVDYRYRDEVNDRRTRRFGAKIDLKDTLQKLLGFISGDSPYSAYLAGVKDLIGAVFGINADRLESEMPAATLEISFETSGGNRTDGEGTGRISAFSMELAVAEGSASALFGGDAYTIEAELDTLDVKAAMLSDGVLPDRDTDLDDYYMYDSRAVHFDGSLRYDAPPAGIENKVYDVAAGFVYAGLESDGSADKIYIVVSDPDDEAYRPFELYYESETLTINTISVGTDGIPKRNTYTAKASFQAFLNRLIDEHFNTRPTMDIYETLAFVFGAISLGDESISVYYDDEFFEKALGLDLKALFDCLQFAYAAEGGTGQISDAMNASGIDLGAYVIGNAFTMTMNIAGDFFEITDDINMPNA